VRYTDPTGHRSCEALDICEPERSRRAKLWQYGVKLEGKWSDENQEAVLLAVQAIGDALMNAGTGFDPWRDFRDAFNTSEITSILKKVNSFEYQDETYYGGNEGSILSKWRTLTYGYLSQN
jgi:hypothetical protein